MSERVFNFNAGPSTLPLTVLEEVQKNMINHEGEGLSLIEMSHRSKTFDHVITDAIARIKSIMEVPSNYKVMFLQGGASQQFSMVPMNIMLNNKSADYVVTGAWSKKAVAEAKKIGKVNIVASSDDKNFSYIPQNIEYNSNVDYTHITSNNTIYGTQWFDFPKVDSPLVADMSSDIMCKKIDVSKFGIIYAGAQKNLGPSGVTLAIIREDLIGKCSDDIPTMLNYKTQAEKDSLFNTPPTFPIYVIQLVLKEIERLGGLDFIEKRNIDKAANLYNAIDNSDDYYRCPTAKNSRSIMNVVFNLATEELEAKFVAEALKEGFIGLKGHRSVGGIRASIYNAMPVEGVEKLVQFMSKFKNNN